MLWLEPWIKSCSTCPFPFHWKCSSCLIAVHQWSCRFISGNCGGNHPTGFFFLIDAALLFSVELVQSARTKCPYPNSQISKSLPQISTKNTSIRAPKQRAKHPDQHNISNRSSQYNSNEYLPVLRITHDLQLVYFTSKVMFSLSLFAERKRRN